MEIITDNRSGQELPIKRLDDLVAFCFKQLILLGTLDKVRYEQSELSISFVTIQEITDLNLRFRSKPGPTDILSFEMDDEVLLGDIVINPDIAKEHANRDELSFEEELWVLIVHGILHLLGYDHMDDEQAQVMEEIEDKIFCAWVDLERSAAQNG